MRGKVKKQCPQTTTFQEKRRAEAGNRTDVARLPVFNYASTLGQIPPASFNFALTLGQTALTSLNYVSTLGQIALTSLNYASTLGQTLLTSHNYALTLGSQRSGVCLHH